MTFDYKNLPYKKKQKNAKFKEKKLNSFIYSCACWFWSENDVSYVQNQITHLLKSHVEFENFFREALMNVTRWCDWTDCWHHKRSDCGADERCEGYIGAVNGELLSKRAQQCTQLFVEKHQGGQSCRSGSWWLLGGTEHRFGWCSPGRFAELMTRRLVQICLRLKSAKYDGIN